MKIKFIALILIAAAILLAGCTAKQDFSAECSEADGTWLAEHSECEYVGRDWCEERGGEFLECESACRHDPEAEICTMQCVIVCKF